MLQLVSVVELDLHEVPQSVCVHHVFMRCLVTPLSLRPHGDFVFFVNPDVLEAQVSYDFVVCLCHSACGSFLCWFNFRLHWASAFAAIHRRVFFIFFFLR